MTELPNARLRPVVPPLAPPWPGGTADGRSRGPVRKRNGARGPIPPTGSTRQRLLDAVVDLSSVVGFHAVTVNDLCELSGISRRTFYCYFPDVPELFRVAYAQLDAELRRELRATWAATGGDHGAVFGALVGFACADPVRADAFFVQALAAGRPVADRRQQTLAWCGTLLSTPPGRGPRGAAVPRPSLSVELACGGAWDAIRTRVAAGDVAGLRRDTAALVAAVTVEHPS